MTPRLRTNQYEATSLSYWHSFTAKASRSVGPKSSPKPTNFTVRGARPSRSLWSASRRPHVSSPIQFLSKHSGAERTLGEDLGGADVMPGGRNASITEGRDGSPPRRGVRGCLFRPLSPRRGDPAFPRPAVTDALPGIALFPFSRRRTLFNKCRNYLFPCRPARMMPRRRR